ncbi:MAG: phenylacetate-CoA oxygenase subunit PaaC [Firmicutes bacterium]|nr:phenylacetate-CoA oxygenase subunit PaaC [Bacillota bacterium]
MANDRSLEFHAALVDLLYQIADDLLVLGVRDSQWLGLAPFLDEDVALATMAQNEFGYAAAFYRLLGELGEGDPDRLAQMRGAGERRNARLVEWPNGLEGAPPYNWPLTVVRHYVFDVFNLGRLEALEHSAYRPLAETAARLAHEQYYFSRHYEQWVRRLAADGAAARGALARAVEVLQPLLADLFSWGEGAEALRDSGAVPALDQPRRLWEQRVGALAAATGLALTAPGPVDPLADGRRGFHTIYLDEVLTALNRVPLPAR